MTERKKSFKPVNKTENRKTYKKYTADKTENRKNGNRMKSEKNAVDRRMYSRKRKQRNHSAL